MVLILDTLYCSLHGINKIPNALEFVGCPDFANYSDFLELRL